MPVIFTGATTARRGVVARLLTVVLPLILLLTVTAACLNDDSDADATPAIVDGSQTRDGVIPTEQPDESITPTTVAGTATSATSSPTTAVREDASTPEPGEGTPVTVLRGRGLTVENLTDQPDTYLGQRVVVHGQVLEVFGNGAFTIVDAAETLLVTGADAVATTEVVPGTFVRVAGQVQTFDIASLEAELGTTFDDVALGRFEGEPVLVADGVQVGPLDVSLVSSDPSNFQDQVIAVVGEVAGVVGPQAFELRDPSGEPGGEHILVVTPYLAIPGDSATGSLARVQGTLRELDVSDLSAFGDSLSFLSDPRYEEYDGETIFVADQVQIVAPAATLTVDELTSGGDDLVGQSVVIRGVVSSIIGDQAFVVGEEAGVLVVVAAGEVPPGLDEGSLVVVDGIATRLDLSAPPVVDPAGGVDWGAGAIEAFEGELILVTRSVTVIESD